MTSVRASFWVGVLLIASLAAMTWMLNITNKDQFSENATYILYADFTNASGIRTKTRLQMNGIDIGKIVGIRHARNKQGKLIARIQLRIMKDYVIYANAQLEKEAESLLGDFRLSIDPGTPDFPILKPGDILSNVQSSSEFERIQSELVEISHNVNDVTRSLAHVLGTNSGEGSLQNILDKLNQTMNHLEASTQVVAKTILQHDDELAHIVQDIARLTHALANEAVQGGNIAQTAENLASFTNKLDRIADQLAMVVGNTQDPIKASTLKGSIENINETVTHLNQVASKVNEGKGTLGKLINDPSIADKAEETLDHTNTLLGSLANLQTQIELRSEYGVPFDKKNDLIQAAIKNTVALRIFPKPDKYYVFEAISDPRGRSRRKITTTGTGDNAVSVQQTEISFDDLKFSAMFAKRYYFTTFRFGIIENTGGIGMNLHALQDNLEFRLDAFDFDRRNPKDNQTILPRLRTTAMYQVLDHVMLQGGVDDPFNANLSTWFLGGVLRFTDDDLRGLLMVAPRTN